MKKLYPLVLLTCLNTLMATQMLPQLIVLQPGINVLGTSLGKFTVQNIIVLNENLYYLMLYDNIRGKHIDIQAENKKGQIDYKIVEIINYQARATFYKKTKMVMLCMVMGVATFFFLATLRQHIYNHFFKKHTS